ncbi:MAG TPA: hypothetical protein VGJ92_04870 [Methanocella sp.]|jgi:hypothetical protein
MAADVINARCPWCEVIRKCRIIYPSFPRDVSTLVECTECGEEFTIVFVKQSLLELEHSTTSIEAFNELCLAYQEIFSDTGYMLWKTEEVALWIFCGQRYDGSCDNMEA